MIDIKRLALDYGQTKVLDNLNLKVKPGEIAAIMGKSGTGKTSLLLCILGFVSLKRGRITIKAQDVTHIPIEDRQLAYLPQDYGLFPHLSVAENISFGLRVRGLPVQQKVRELLHAVDLSASISSRNVRQLSGGEQQRVALARALAIAPRAFLLDEPLSAIDIETKEKVGRELRVLIKRLHIPAIIITHDPRDAATLADTVYRLENRRLKLVKKQ